MGNLDSSYQSETQVRYQPCLRSHSVSSGDEVAFSPSLGEIGYIDEDDDDLTSDMSEASYSEEKRNTVEQEQMSVVLTNEADPSFPNHTPCQTVAEEISSQNEPHEAVPSRQVAQVLHSNQSIPFEDDALSHYQNALQMTGRVPERYGDPHVILNGQAAEDLNYATLEESMVTLKSALADKSALSTFEKLTRCKQGATMNAAKLQENMTKNRYKDVLPYDESRVVLRESYNDYINASYVHMKIPPMWTKNEYIATQGPLPHTCSDFWQMVWEEKSQIIVMVTTLKERNRVKCHKYWPDLYEVLTFGHMQITCFRETITCVAITRDLLVINDKTNEERHVIQLQHVKWPDHGVPQDGSDFVAFVQHLRTLRHSMGGPVIVHCSAGVGRTGVFILMETALSYIEAGKPLYPHELVRILRDQRVMMVQTVSQYKFICEAILKVHGDIQGKLNGGKHR